MIAPSEISIADALYSVSSVRALDRCAIDERGIPGYTLMTRAAESAVDLARRRFPGRVTWTVVCGGGNNAGDGYVVARLAAAAGIDVQTIALVEPAKLAGDAGRAVADFLDAGLVASAWDGRIPDDTGLIVDALLGSGLQRDVTGRFLAAVHAINGAPAPVLSLDIPTGLDGDTGRIHGAAVSADATVTFVGQKAGLFLGEGPALAGDVTLSSLDIPADCYAAQEPLLRLIPETLVAECLPPRSRDAHKGSFGHVVVVGGGPGMPGAVRLAGEAALRAGAGLVSVATHADHAAEIAAARPELMVHAAHDVRDVASLIDRADVIAVGPGLGQTDWSRDLLAAALDSRKPLVVDADALNLIAGSDFVRPDSVITPHPGEAGRLLGIETAEVQANRINAVRSLTTRYGATAILKGAGSLICDGEEPPWLCSKGNPGMAAPGMGDVLTGVVAALVAQRLPPQLAAVCGVDVHARAGDLAAASRQRGMLASDLVERLRTVVNP